MRRANLFDRSRGIDDGDAIGFCRRPPRGKRVLRARRIHSFRVQSDPRAIRHFAAAARAKRLLDGRIQQQREVWTQRPPGPWINSPMVSKRNSAATW